MRIITYVISNQSEIYKFVYNNIYKRRIRKTPKKMNNNE